MKNHNEIPVKLGEIKYGGRGILRPDYIQACFSKDLYTQVDEMSLNVVEVESDILP